MLAKLEKAAAQFKLKKIVITGGVSANSGLRKQVELLAAKKSWIVAIPPVRYCTDNAAMIGLVGILRLQAGQRHDF